jgi:hypothetical protein
MKLRIWHMPQIGCDATIYIPVETLEESKKILDILACYDLFQLENNIKPDFSNVSGLQIFDEETQEWEDWHLETDDDYWDNIDDYFEDNENMRAFTEELFGQLKGNF